MAATYDRDLRTILKKAGCRLVRPGKGSHEVWHSPVTDRHFSVPKRIKNRHTANGVLHQAGLPKAF